MEKNILTLSFFSILVFNNFLYSIPGEELDSPKKLFIRTSFGYTPSNWFVADIPSKRNWYYNPDDIYNTEPQLVKPQMLNSLSFEIENNERSIESFIEWGKYSKKLILYHFSILTTLKYNLLEKVNIPIFSLLMLEDEYLSCGIGFYKKYGITIPIVKKFDTYFASDINLAFMPITYHYGEISWDTFLLPTISIRYRKFHIHFQLFVLSGRLVGTSRKRNFYRYYPRIQLGLSSGFQRLN